MERTRKFTLSRRTLILLVSAAVLCLVGLLGAVGATQAQLVYQSQIYQADMEQTHLGIALTEKTGSEETARIVNVGETSAVDLEVTGEKEVLLPATEVSAVDDESSEQVQYTLLDGDKAMIPGKTYKEEINVANASNLGQFVRVTIRKNWADENGVKTADSAKIDPSLIELDFDESGIWVKSEAESTDERMVFYLVPQLGADNGVMPEAPLVTGIRLAKSVVDNPLPEGKYHIALYAQVDSLQTENAIAAAKSAWGIDLTADGLSSVGASWAAPVNNEREGE